MRNLLYLLLAGMLFFGCTGPAGPADGAPEGGEPGAAEPPEGEAPDGGEAPEYMPEGLIEPSDLTYMGAFRLPEESGSSNWMWSGYGATYYPDGDPNGPDDGYPGSLFAVGHDQHQMVSEISIPAPRIADSTKDLNTAETLQPFADITGNMFGYLEIPRQGLEYLPPQGEQETGKLHFAWGQHLENENTPTHGWAELDISDPQPIGRWHLDGHSAYTTNDYMFSIPENWAAANTPGLLLATGRFRDGRWSGLGPALYAYGPWNDGNPPAPESTVDSVTPLLLYGRQLPGVLEIESDDSMAMRYFAEPDEWSGGAWLTHDDMSAVIFVGTKAMGNSWYGFSNGVAYPISEGEGEVYPEVPEWPHDARGWWADSIEAQIIFYDPSDLAAVANGEMETWEPQPYAVMSIDDVLFDPGYDYEKGKRYSLGAAAFDRENGLLYVFERLADEDDKSIVHVWRLG